MKKHCIYLVYVLICTNLIHSGCSSSNIEQAQNIEPILDSVRLQYAPDSRTAVFSVILKQTMEGLILTGETNLSEAKEAVKNRLALEGISFQDSIIVLPEKQLFPDIFGVVTISVANIRAAPAHSSELTTQLLLGTPVKILKKSGFWYQIQGPDQYIGWTDRPAIATMDEETLNNWLASEKIIFKDIYGSSFDLNHSEPNKVSDLVLGNILKMKEESEDYYLVEFPDARQAYIEKKAAEKLDEWILNSTPNQRSLVSYAKELVGIPYLWGGTSVKGMDCSGFTKTVFFMNGQLLSRDASQQVLQGVLVDDTGDFEKLQPGDLLFFGRRDSLTGNEKTVHVGMWLGNHEYIHASGQVMINSMDSSATNFDAYNFSRYLRTKRMLNEEARDLEYLKKNSIW